MQSLDRRPSVTVSRVLGTLSVVSGAALIRFPRASAKVYALPAHPGLLRALGVRDIAVGCAMLSGRTARAGAAARGVSDCADLLLIASEVVRGRRVLRSALPRLAGAAALVALSVQLAARL
jgi:hypothetical protein